MTTRDLHSNVKVTQMIDPIVGNNTTEGTPGAGLDTVGFASAEIVFAIGNSLDTLSGSVYVDLILEDSDDDASYDPVINQDFVLVGSDGLAVKPDSSGIVATINAPAEDSRKVRVGYVGNRRYVRGLIDFTGTHTNGMPIGMLGLQSHASQQPVSD